METRFKKKAKIFDIGVAAVAVILSVGMMLYGVFFYGLKVTWPELVLNLFYIACLVMMGLYFFNRLDTQRFNYWAAVQLLVIGVRGCDDPVARHSLPTSLGLSLDSSDVLHPLGAAPHDAHLFLCP